MNRQSLLCCLCVFSHLVFSSAQLSCSQQQYTPTSCLEVRRDPLMNNSDAQLDCTSDGLSGLVTVEEEGQFEALRSFANVLLSEGELLWLGYYYDASQNVLLRADGSVTESDVFGVSENFAPNGENPGNGVCIAMNKDGQLNRRLCTETLAYGCYQDMSVRITSFTVSPSRFLADAAMATLTCNFQPPNATVMWRHNGMELFDTDDQSITTAQDRSTVVIPMVESGFRGQYECVVSNSFGGVVSEAITLVEAGGVDMSVPIITSIVSSPLSSDIRTGSSVNLTCNSNDTSANYSWFVNGTAMASATTNTFTINSFVSGYYQCRASLTTGENSVYTLRLDAQDPPGLDESISAYPLSRTSILVSWTPPVFSRDPLLLRYSLFYMSGDSLNPDDYSSAQSQANILPTLRNGTVSSSNLVEYELSGLEVGVVYWISVRASYRDLNASNSIYIARSATYGLVPDKAVEGLNVSRTIDSKSLLVRWQKLVTAPPTGEIVLYEIEYRNRGKGVSMTARIAAFYDFFSILELEDASDYEVRVRAGIQVNGDPPMYEFNEPTKWLLASGVVPTVPSPPPTLPVRVPLNGGQIAAIVVCVSLIVFLIAIILIVGFTCCCLKKGNGTRYHKQGHSDEEKSKETGSTLSSLRNEDHDDETKEP